MSNKPAAKTFIDKYEDWILNAFRRVLSLLSLLLLIGFVVCLVASFSKVVESFSVDEFSGDGQISFEEPVFETAEEDDQQTQEIDLSKIPDENKEKDLQDNEVSGGEPDPGHSMPAHDAEIKKMVKMLLPLYFVMGQYEDTDAFTSVLKQYLANRISSIDAPDIMDSDQLVDGAAKYLNQFVAFYTTQLKLKEKASGNMNSPTTHQDLIKDAKEDAILAQALEALEIVIMDPLEPFVLQVESLQSNFDNFVASQDEAHTVSLGVSLQYLTFGGVLLGSVCCLVIILLIFKAENSLRRQADAQEEIE